MSPRLMVAAREPVADGVWLVRGGLPRRTMNVYLLRDGDGVTVFDAGIRGMGVGIAALARALGGARRVVLSHAHPDHRGGANGIGAPVFCHAAERADAEGTGGRRYFAYERRRQALMMRLADGGPVTIAGTLAEGDEVAGFQVVHLPGHAPGLIALWRARDRLALAGDAFYTLHGPEPELPRRAYSLDTEQARVSLRRLAALRPDAAWPGHARPVTGDVRAQLERAAERPAP